MTKKSIHHHTKTIINLMNAFNVFIFKPIKVHFSPECIYKKLLAIVSNNRFKLF